MAVAFLVGGLGTVRMNDDLWLKLGGTEGQLADIR
jgi:hypothetical protein